MQYAYKNIYISEGANNAPFFISARERMKGRTFAALISKYYLHKPKLKKATSYTSVISSLVIY